MELFICGYAFAWWGVFCLLIPRRSPFQVLAFIPAAICALAIPNLIWDFAPSATLAETFGIAGYIMPFAIVVVLLIKKHRNKKSPNKALQAIGAKARLSQNPDVG